MRYDFSGLLHYIFNKYIFITAENLYGGRRLIYLCATKLSVRPILAFLRYNTLLYNSFFIDVVGFERSALLKYKNLNLAIIYIFFLRLWGAHLIFSTFIYDWGRAPSIGEFFGGATWPERETAELLGVSFTHKIDARRLMLDYSFIGAPLLKQFPITGYEELEYNGKERWLIYRLLKLRDDLDIHLL